MSFYPVTQPVVDWPDGQVEFVESECPFDIPKVAIAVKYLTGFQLCVRHISLDAVPCSVGLVFLQVNGYVHLALQLQVFVVATVVDALLCQLSRADALLQPFKAFLTVMPVLCRTLLAAGHDEPAAVFPLDFRHVAILQVERQDAFLHFTASKLG